MRYCFFFLIFLVILLTSACRENINTNEEFLPYEYKYSIREIEKKFSEKILLRAEKEFSELKRVNIEGKYKPDLESIDSHPTPEWYRDARFSIFFDWGLYSIAGYGEKGWSRARYPDWYLNHMYNDLETYHDSVWGENFHRDDFIPMFDAENFNAEEIIGIVKKSGAEYFVPFSKHHDGFCLWDSYFTFRDAKDMYPGKDLIRELIDECEKAGLHHGFYFSVEEYEYPLIIDDTLAIRYWSENMAPDNAGLATSSQEIIGDFVPEIHNRMISGKVPVNDFIEDYIVPQAKDYIDRYDPDILWFDGEWQRSASYYQTPEIVAYFYNKAEGRKKVVSNDRLGMNTRGKHGDFYTSETDEVVRKTDYPWEENRSMSESYGFNHTDSLENYLSPEELVHMLVRIVAKGGNLNLIVNPDGSGKIPRIQVKLLEEMGEWLDINGEAIYATRTYEKTADNTQLGQPVWYTMSKDSTWGYAIVLDWPKSETFICPGANPVWGSDVYMLGYDIPLEWVDTGRDLWGMTARIPEEMLADPSKRPSDYAWVLKFKYDKRNQYGR